MIGAENIIMDIKHLDYIITLADERSLSIAAQKLSVTQSAISQHLTKLEKSLGVPLFNRTNSEWTLTEEGRLYLERSYVWKSGHLRHYPSAPVQEAVQSGLA